MTEPANPQEETPFVLGDALGYAEFRKAARSIAEARQRAVQRYIEQANNAAKAEADYQREKAKRFLQLKQEGAGVTECEAIIKGDSHVNGFLLERELQREILKARREEIAGIDGDRASLHRLGEWSQKVTND